MGYLVIGGCLIGLTIVVCIFFYGSDVASNGDDND